jgi:hypothetical protein
MESDQSAAAAGAASGSDIVQVPALAGDQLPSLRDAARAVATFREKQRNPEQTPQDPPARQAEEPAARQDPTTESADEAGAAPPETEATGETEATDPAETQPLELPRSWTKDRADHWAKLDRATQELLLQHDRDASAAVRRSQNEAAEQRKAMEAERAKVETARTQYETAVPTLLATLAQQQAGEFPDVKTHDDVMRLAREDWPRYVLWDASQKRLAGLQQQEQAISERQSQEKATKHAEFVQRELELLVEKFPDIADSKKGPALREAAVTTLREIGFSDAELGKLWKGEAEISLHDHRLQLLVRDALRFRSAQAAAKNAARLAVPPVQRPGTAQPRGAAAAAAVQNLSERLNKTGSLKDAARLLSERRKAAR